MSDGREEREEQEAWRRHEEPKSREDKLDHDHFEEEEPERGGS